MYNLQVSVSFCVVRGDFTNTYLGYGKSNAEKKSHSVCDVVGQVASASMQVLLSAHTPPHLP